tara:strand:+ start:21 stop:536 length:516 start_codon:yes stop_codon:yes gene_type:complete
MAKRIIAIGGMPASGKTTLMKKIIKEYIPLNTFKYKLVRGMYCPRRLIYFIGVYDESTFSGTDKLSMAVQPHFVQLLSKLTKGVFVFEGDRLFNQSLFDKVKCEKIIIDAEEETLERRHKQRNDNQSDKFIKAKRTKLNNILEKNSVTLLPNNTDEQNKYTFRYILERINE